MDTMSSKPLRPLFSIITVTYNAQDTLPVTLSSVAKQTCELYEHIIVDGASTDQTLSVLSGFSNPRLHVMSGHDNGIYDAMNKGLAEAKGDYVIFLNAGDSFHSPDTLQHIADTIMEEDYPGVVYGQTDIVDAEGRRLGPRHLQAPERLTLKDFADGMVVCHQAFVALRRITDPYDLHYCYSADYEWCILVLQHARRTVGMNEVIVDYLNEGTTTRHRRESLWERYRIMCYYYGTLPTILRHVKFFFRSFRKGVRNK